MLGHKLWVELWQPIFKLSPYEGASAAGDGGLEGELA